MKTKVGIIFGGCSSEYDVSLVSVTSVIKNINKEKYDVVLIGITKQGDFYLYQGDIENQFRILHSYSQFLINRSLIRQTYNVRYVICI